MKLHLPKRLRAALLAVITTAVAAPTTASATGTAVFDNTYFQHATQTHANMDDNDFQYDDPTNPDNRLDENFHFVDPTSQDPADYIFDSSTNDWTLTIDVYDLRPALDIETEETLNAMIITNAGYTIDPNNDHSELNQANSFCISMDRFGRVRLVTSDEENKVTNDIVMFNVGTIWDKEERGDETVSIRMTLSWDADGGLYKDPDTRYGALTLQSVQRLSDDGAHTVVEDIKSFHTGRVLTNNYDMESDLFSITDFNDTNRTSKGGLYSVVGQGGTVALSLLTPGNAPAWNIKGDASIKYLLAGKYYDNTRDKYRTMRENERVQFIGGNSTLWLTSGNYTYQNPTWCSSDPEGKIPGRGIGFGADKGATLVVAESVLNSTVNANEGVTVNALGDGTIRFEVNTNAIESVDLPAVIPPPIAEDDDAAGGEGEGEGGEIAGGEGEGEADDTPGFEIVPDIAAGDRTLTFNKLGANTNVELDVTGNRNVTVVLGTATIGNGNDTNTTRITRLSQSEDGTAAGALNVHLHNGSLTQKTSYVGVLENKEGDLNITGREMTKGLDEEENVIDVPVYSRLKAQELLATGNIKINGIVKATKQVKAGLSLAVNSGYLETPKATATGHLNVGAKDSTDATVIVHGTTSVGNTVAVYGYASLGNLTTGKDYSVTVHNTDNEDAYLTANRITTKSISRVLTSVEEIEIESDEEDDELLDDEEVEVEIVETYQDLRINYNEGVDPAAQPLLAGNVYVGAEGIRADTIAADTTIYLAPTSRTGVSATNIKNATLEIGTGAKPDVIMTKMCNKDGVLTINPNEGEGLIESTGHLSAETMELPDTYTLKALRLTVENGINSQPLQTTGKTEGAAISITPMKEVVSGTPEEPVIRKERPEIVLGGLTADSLNIANNSNVTINSIETTQGTTVGYNVVIQGITADQRNGARAAVNTSTVKGDLTASVNFTLKSLTTEGILTTGSNAILEKVHLANTYKNKGKATLTNVSLGEITFGGEDGDAYSTSGNYNKLAISGILNNTSAGTKLTLSGMHVDATNLDFSEKGDNFELINATDGNSYTLPEAKNILIYVKPYTWAEVGTEGDSLQISGRWDEVGIKKQLTTTEVRRSTMKALEGNLTPNSVASKLHDKLGDVLHTSLKARTELLDAISGASITALADSQRRGIQDVQSSLRNRIIQMGGNADEESIGAQAWAQADGSFTTSDSGEDGPGYDFNTWGATVGANVDVSKSLVAGMSFSASYGELDVDSADHATGNNDAYYINFFARHQSKRWTQLLILTAGMNDMDLERTVGDYKASGETDATSFSAYYELGYTVGLNDSFSHILQPIVSASITSAKVDGYKEKGSIGNAGLEADDASLTYGTVGIGLRYQGVIHESVFERFAVLELRAQVTQDFGDKTDEAAVAMGRNKYSVYGTDTTGTGYTLGAGLSIPVQLHTTVFADVDMTIRPDYTGCRANLGLRYDF